MRVLGKLGFAVLAAALVFALPMGASAGRLSISEQNFTATWDDLDSQLGFIQCEVIIRGVLHSRVITKTARSLIGLVTSAAVGPCDAGGAVVLDGNGGRPQTLPWHIRYDSFTGTLPGITGIRVELVDVSLLVSIGSMECLYKGSMFGTLTRNTFTQAVTGLQADSRWGVAIYREELNDSGIFCDVGGYFSGTAAVNPAAIVRLI